MKPPSIAFINNVLRLELTEDSRYSSYEISATIIKALIEASQKLANEQGLTDKASLEFTFASTNLREDFPKLLEEYGADINIYLGTITTIEEAQLALKWSQEIRPFVCFAPHHDQKIKNLFDANSLDFIPGIAKLEDLSNYSQKNPNEKPKLFKVFPANAKTAEQLLKILEGPYPELKTLSHRINLNENHKEGEQQLYKVNSPLSYFKIKENFLNNPDSQLLIQAPENSGLDLIRAIRKEYPESKISANGLSSLAQEELKLLVEAGADIIGSACIIKDTVQQLSSGKITLSEGQSKITNELYKTIIDSNINYQAATSHCEATAAATQKQS